MKFRNYEENVSIIYLRQYDGMIAGLLNYRQNDWKRLKFSLKETAESSTDW